MIRAPAPCYSPLFPCHEKYKLLLIADKYIAPKELVRVFRRPVFNCYFYARREDFLCLLALRDNSADLFSKTPCFLPCSFNPTACRAPNAAKDILLLSSGN